MNVSVVIPVYRSEACLEELVARLRAAFAKTGRSYEIVLVNDASPDGSWRKIREIAQLDAAVHGINLRKNAGQDNAIMAGLAEASGDVVVIMDDDLQHAPEDIEGLVRGVENGADVCYAHFSRKRQAWWKNLGSRLNDRLANLVLCKPKTLYLSPFKAIAGDVAREITRYDGPFPYVDGLLFRVTDNVTHVVVEHHERFAGRGNYTVARSLGVWLRVATLFSVVPLRIATVLGFSFAGLGLLLAVGFAVYKLLVPDQPMGWASTIMTILVLGGTQLACLGIIGEYVGRSFLHLSRRPQYSIRERT
jgi:glycosyltransferase involved in cell wall biosynthesis